MEQDKGGSLGAIFDFSFTRFVTLKLVKVIYFIAFFVSLIGVILMIYGAFQESTNWGITALLVSPIGFIVYILLARVWLELVVVLFRIEENTRHVDN